MEKEFLIDCINKGLSLKKISKLCGKAPSTITYWLNKFNLKTNNLSFKVKGKIDYNNQRCCPKCKITKELNEFYNRRDKIGSSVYCKTCTNKQVLDRQRELKQQAVDYKGGYCIICGYNKCNAALEFHHLEPDKKDFSISQLKKYAFTENIKKELDKCILLCSNCHREFHSGILILSKL